MAQIKNEGEPQSFSYSIQCWRLGTYILRSKEDLKKGKNDSNSVKKH